MSQDIFAPFNPWARMPTYSYWVLPLKNPYANRLESSNQTCQFFANAAVWFRNLVIRFIAICKCDCDTTRRSVLGTTFGLLIVVGLVSSTYDPNSLRFKLVNMISAVRTLLRCKSKFNSPSDYIECIGHYLRIAFWLMKSNVNNILIHSPSAIWLLNSRRRYSLKCARADGGGPLCDNSVLSH